MSDEAGHDGIFVVIEGIDGAGTSTQAAAYAALLRSKKRLVHVTREPSGGPVGSLLRLVLTRRISFPAAAHAETMALLFAADRLDHVHAEILPLLREGYVVISDRYDLSSMVYQSATAETGNGAAGDDVIAWIRSLNRNALRPHATVVINVPPEVAHARRVARGGSVEIFEEPALQARLAGAYARAEAFLPGDRVIHIDGNRPSADVTRALAEALAPIVDARG